MWAGLNARGAEDLIKKFFQTGYSRARRPLNAGITAPLPLTVDTFIRQFMRTACRYNLRETRATAPQRCGVFEKFQNSHAAGVSGARPRLPRTVPRRLNIQMNAGRACARSENIIYRAALNAFIFAHGFKVDYSKQWPNSARLPLRARGFLASCSRMARTNLGTR